MIIVKLIGKRYDVDELEENSKVVRKWLVLKKLKKEKINEKYYAIQDCTHVTKTFDDMIKELDEEDRKFYNDYIKENWKETFPIMKDVSAYAKIRPTDGTEFCILI